MMEAYTFLADLFLLTALFVVTRVLSEWISKLAGATKGLFLVTDVEHTKVRKEVADLKLRLDTMDGKIKLLQDIVEDEK